ncbi:MAG: cofactor-independent phosphoglycerate mutase [Planctomycetaceae bacterium]|nr:cofactor-independent phosphoglycerate mutase [Planctomycetaceae bacterium]
MSGSTNADGGRKYVILIPDGCADFPVSQFGGKTPLQYAAMPNIDALAKTGIVGCSANVPVGLSPGSDVATLGLLGYNPAEYYTGRAPLEAVAQDIQLGNDDWAIRCNLVTLQETPQGEIMQSFTAGHISTEEAAELIDTLNKTLRLEENELTFYTGVSYRNLAVIRAGNDNCRPLFSRNTMTAPPHDYTDKLVATALPTGDGADILLRLMNESKKLFAGHPVNKKRIAAGKLPATQIWLWGLGKKPALLPFSQRFAKVLASNNFSGGMITAVDLLRGIASLIGWRQIEVPGITGYVDTDYAAKGRYAADALKDLDIVCIHVEATDEAGHEGDAAKKVKALEDIDGKLLPPLLDALCSNKEWRLLISPDHLTPVALKTHTSEPVPWLMCGSGIKPDSNVQYNEETAAQSPVFFKDGWKMMETFLRY